MDYTFEVATDPDDDSYYSIYISNGEGSSCEVAGKLAYPEVAATVLLAFNRLTQEEIREIWHI